MSWLGNVLKEGVNSLVGGAPGALLNMGTSLIGSVVSNNMNRDNARFQQEWQEKMNLQQQAWQEDMWNKTNEYNSPVQQLARLRDAGINPNNAIASISGSNASSQMAQQPQIPSAAPIPGVQMDLVGAMNQGMQTNKEMQLLDAQRENIEADTLHKLQDTSTGVAQEKLLIEQGKSFKIDNEWKPQEKQAVIDTMRAQAKEYIAQFELSESEKRRVDYMVDIMLPLETQLTVSQIKEAASRISANLASAAASYASAALSNEAAKTEREKQSLIEKQTEGQKIQNENNAAFTPLERLVGILGNVEGVKNLRLTNYEKKYFTDQLEAYGMPVSEMYVTDLVKLGMLADIGYGSKAETDKRAHQIAGKGIIEGAKSVGQSLLDAASNAAGFAAGGYIGGKTFRGKGVTNDYNYDVHVGSVNTAPYRNVSGIGWNP